MRKSYLSSYGNNFLNLYSLRRTTSGTVFDLIKRERPTDKKLFSTCNRGSATELSHRLQLKLLQYFNNERNAQLEDQEKILNKQKSNCKEAHASVSVTQETVKKKVSHQHLQGYAIGILLRYSRMQVFCEIKNQFSSANRFSLYGAILSFEYKSAWKRFNFSSNY